MGGEDGTGWRTVAKLSEFRHGALLVEVEGTTIGLIRQGEKVYAYRNSCPHQGGPVAEGNLVGNTQCRVAEGGLRRQTVSRSRLNLACPWHGIEYDLETGVCKGDARMRLKSYKVLVEDGLVRIRP
ncbi:MAG: Rieske 2Fe-2S domain-containing protein [Thaumarchaeota archaeon]|nr:Rieske 2Fe-2S domain-containing protein [Nitrososphaerota archaeon]